MVHVCQLLCVCIHECVFASAYVCVFEFECIVAHVCRCACLSLFLFVHMCAGVCEGWGREGGGGGGGVQMHVSVREILSV